MTPSSQDIAGAVLGRLIARGVQDFVVCPGSRSQSLALAAAQAEKMGLIRLHVRVDERSAAFFALGLARETGRPAPIIVTSGTAVANLLPAVQEAHYARVPMILLTGDRPADLRGTRANQTVHSTDFTREFVRLRREVSEADSLTEILRFVDEAHSLSLGPGGGPSHLNIALVEPLSGTLDDLFDEITADTQQKQSGASVHTDVSVHTDAFVQTDTYLHTNTYVHTAEAPLSVVIAGADAGPAAEEFAHLAGLPLLAEPSSGARFGREAIQHYEELLLDETLFSRVGRVIIFGHPTLTRVIPRLVQAAEAVVIDQAGPGLERYNPGRSVREFAMAARVQDNFDVRAKRAWLGEWITRDRVLRAERSTLHQPDLAAATATGYKERSAYARAEVARLREPVSREHLTESLWLATWPHDRLVVAASRLIRVLNAQAAPRNIRVHSNRGLAGIDGTIATALGVAVASQSQADPRQAAGTTRVLIGDIAFLHDASSLLLPDAEKEGLPRIQLIIGNDGGGTIFDLLEVAVSTKPDLYERVMRTPQRVNVAALAEAYGWKYTRVENRGELERLFTVPVAGPEIVEVIMLDKLLDAGL